MTAFCTIVSQGRSGSNYLQYLLGSHPDITFFGELFNPGRIVPRPDLEPSDDPRYDYENSRAQDVTTYLRDRLSGHNTVVGFKMPWDSIEVHSECLDAFQALSFKIVLLKRRNKVDQFLSLRLAIENAHWLSTERYSRQKITIDGSRLLGFYEKSNRIDAELSDRCARFPCFNVVYEDLLATSDHGPILKFLGVSEHVLKPGTVRSRTRRKQQVIENFDALAERFSDHPIGQQLIAET